MRDRTSVWEFLAVLECRSRSTCEGCVLVSWRRCDGEKFDTGADVLLAQIFVSSV